ncbi:hypothetical protein [Roseivivax lentus]|uniref:hypothetical protein n=1 Tax=Roseivivax lentus TaxID=633194 RepID=UPI0013562E0A|nr:hypothetical protein [Roseivivax lentus]
MTAVSACVQTPTVPATDTSPQQLTDARYVYGYCLFRGGVTLGYKNNFSLTKQIETQVRSLCQEYREEYRVAVEADTWKDRSDFSDSEMEIYRPATSKLVISEVEKIVFDGVQSELKHLQEMAND